MTSHHHIIMAGTFPQGPKRPGWCLPARREVFGGPPPPSARSWRPWLIWDKTHRVFQSISISFTSYMLATSSFYFLPNKCIFCKISLLLIIIFLNSFRWYNLCHWNVHFLGASHGQPRYFVLFSDMIMYCKIQGKVSPILPKTNGLECGCMLPLKNCKVETLVGKGVFKLICQREELILYSNDGSQSSEVFKSTFFQNCS